MHPLPASANISSDDSQLAPLLDKDTEASPPEGDTGGYSSDHPMTSPTSGQYQKLSSSPHTQPTSPFPGLSPIQVQKALSERSCTVFIFMLNIY